MAFIITTLAVAFAAFCIWLTVRIVNRREKWAKWMAAWVAVSLPALYVLSIGPTARLAQEGFLDESTLGVFYAPLGVVVGICPEWVGTAFLYYFVFWGVRIDI